MGSTGISVLPRMTNSRGALGSVANLFNSLAWNWLAALQYGQGSQIVPQEAQVRVAPLYAAAFRIGVHLLVRSGQIIVWDAGPEVVGRMVIHVHWREKRAFQRIGRIGNQSVPIR